jgi:hypothetical protein
MEKYKWEDIFKNSTKHPIGDGRQSIFKIGDFTVSIVGGRQGLYGNFFTTFELAIIDKSGNFITKEILEKNNGDDVLGYLELDEVVEILNFLNQKYGK